MPDILFILLLALVIFGPKKLPEIARQIAKYMLQFRQMSNDFKRQLESEMLKIELEEKQAPAKSYQPCSDQSAAPGRIPAANSFFLNRRRPWTDTLIHSRSQNAICFFPSL